MRFTLHNPHILYRWTWRRKYYAASLALAFEFRLVVPPDGADVTANNFSPGRMPNTRYLHLDEIGRCWKGWRLNWLWISAVDLAVDSGCRSGRGLGPGRGFGVEVAHTVEIFRHVRWFNETPSSESGWSNAGSHFKATQHNKTYLATRWKLGFVSRGMHKNASSRCSIAQAPLPENPLSYSGM